MKHLLLVAGPFLVALFAAISLNTYGCSDSASINPVAELAVLTVTPGTLQPVFNGATTQYTVELPTSTTTVTITAQPAVAGDTVAINGQTTTRRVITLQSTESVTLVSIVVSESTSNSRTYTVLLRKTNLVGNNSLQRLAISPGSLAPVFNPDTLNYTVDVASTVGTVTVTPTLQDPAAAMTVNGQATNSGQARTISLNGAGSNTMINIIVTVQNGTAKIYSVNVMRAALGGNNSLSALNVSAGSLDPAFQAAMLIYMVDVASSIASVTVSATKADPNAVMSGSVTAPAGTATGQATIQLDGPGTSKSISIVVTASNGISKSYSITVNRAATASDNNLSALSVRPGSLDPSFDSGIRNYRVSVGADINDVTVIATKADPSAVMSGDVTAGTGQATGQATIQLDGSRTRIAITVTAPNGDRRVYTITINRASNGGGGDNEND
jgi:hypothetical protein